MEKIDRRTKKGKYDYKFQKLNNKELNMVKKIHEELSEILSECTPNSFTFKAMGELIGYLGLLVIRENHLEEKAYIKKYGKEDFKKYQHFLMWEEDEED